MSTTIQAAAAKHARSRGLDLKQLDDAGKTALVDALAKDVKVSPAQVRAALVKTWSAKSEAGAAQSVVGQAASGAHGQRDVSGSTVGVRLDAPAMRGVRDRTADGTLRKVRGDQRVGNNPSLLARAPELVERFGGGTVDELRALFGGLSLSAIAKMDTAERELRLSGPEGSLYFNRLGGEVEALVRALDPNGRAPLTADEFGKLSPDKRRQVMDALETASSELVQWASHKDRGAEPGTLGAFMESLDAQSVPLVGSGEHRGLPSFDNALQRETGAIVELLDQGWDVSVKAKANAQDVSGTGISSPLSGSLELTLADGLNNADKAAPLTDVIEAVLAEGVRMGARMMEADVKTWVSFYSMSAAFAGKPGIEVDLRGDSVEFGAAARAVKQRIAERFDLSAAPEGYAKLKKDAPDASDVTGRALDYTGDSLHFKIGANAPGIAASLATPNLYYLDTEKGRSPVDELIGAVLRQGMNISVRAIYEGVVEPLREAKGQLDKERPALTSSAPLSDEARARLLALFAGL